ncbi:putative RNA-directed DNA polymerase from transposon BS [Araneus ventricosus]|uniref:Putative RNA-directed DNA polymerase from transposon BS n=1 Tax=Araneus ventricosus TaxID=182803 RepID=A0A4Y2NCZ3_ARAVE|nr:putative RNA-directed DNA polymerase from transposon BS [Araneus ventricosus]
MVFALTEFINNIFNFNHWEACLEDRGRRPGKDPTVPENYRPISLLRTLGKITENFILDKLDEHLIGNKILCPEQFEFRKSLTTNHQLLRVVEYITSSFDRGECTAAVFLDIQKAFDMLWKQGLIHKLIMYKTPPNLVQLLNSYLDDRKFVVRIGNSSSKPKTMKVGVFQGGNFPFLYSIYVNDIPTTHKNLLGTHVDDTAILAKNKTTKYTAEAINHHLQKLYDCSKSKGSSCKHITSPCTVHNAKPFSSYKPDIPDQKTSLILFLIKELRVPPNQHLARHSASELSPLPLPAHRLEPPKSSTTNR